MVLTCFECSLFGIPCSSKCITQVDGKLGEQRKPNFSEPFFIFFSNGPDLKYFRFLRIIPNFKEYSFIRNMYSIECLYVLAHGFLRKDLQQI